jgi:predicted Zn-dependent peptidase
MIMTRPRTALLLLIIVLLPVLGRAETLEDKVTEFTLDNGMKFIVAERHMAPVFFGAIIFRVGSINESEGTTGISHLLEHMMFKGTTTVGTKDYNAEKPYLEEEDRLAAEIQDLRQRIGSWRLKIFENAAREALASLPEDRKTEIGSDRVKELSALLDVMATGTMQVPQAETYSTLLEEGGTDYLNLFADLKSRELDLEQTMAEHKKLIITEELWDAYLQNGARMINAFTSNDVTAYFAYLPANRLELWMMLESDRMRDPVFREFYSERNVVAEERRLHENDHESVLYDELMAAAFEASPYGRPVIGWMSDIETITRDELRQHQKRFYAPNNSFAVLVGDLDPRSVRKMAEDYFASIPAQTPPGPIETREPEQRGERRVVVEFPANPEVMIGYHVPTKPHPDSYPIEVLASILGQGRTSRLYGKVYEEMALTSRAPEVTFEPGERLDNLLVIHAVPRHPHTAEEVEAAIYAEIEDIQASPPGERELQRVKNILDANLVRMLGSNLGIAFNLGMNEAFRGDWRAFLTDVNRIKKVSPEDISGVASKYLLAENRTVATLVEAAKDASAEEAVDFRTLMEWVHTLPEEEQAEIFQRVQSMTAEERTEYARELMKRMKSAEE